MVRTDSGAIMFPARVRLGPLSMVANLSNGRHTDGSSRPTCRDGSPNRAAWRSPDWKAVGFRYPGPIPRIRRITAESSADADPPRRVLGPMHRQGEGFLLTVRCTTGGDVNPDCRWAFWPISFGWPRRWPPAPAVPALGCFARTNRKLISVSGTFTISPVSFLPDDKRKSTTIRRARQLKKLCFSGVFHIFPQVVEGPRVAR